MNNTRRNEIARVQSLITAGLNAFNEAKIILEDQKTEEEEAFADASQGKQDGDWGQESQACTESMQTLIDAIDSIDLSEEMDELGRAVDRNLSAPTGRLTKDEVEARRFDRLPQWAKDKLNRAVDDANAAILKVSQKYKDWVEGSKNPMFDVWDGSLKGKEIPCQRVRFPQAGVVLYMEGKNLCVHADNGAVYVMPRSGNEIYVKSAHWDALTK